MFERFRVALSAQIAWRALLTEFKALNSISPISIYSLTIVLLYLMPCRCLRVSGNVKSISVSDLPLATILGILGISDEGILLPRKQSVCSLSTNRAPWSSSRTC